MGRPLALPDRRTFDAFLDQAGRAMHANDRPPASLEAWRRRRAEIRQAMTRAMGPGPDTACPLEPRIVGTIRRQGYRIDKVLLQTRPDVWATTSLYVPDNIRDRVPAVLVVHGHWRGARRDPTVQARCLGLVHLGFVVLAIDAFGAGERYTAPAPGTYHGSLYGGTLWPTGNTLLGMQVYDNRRAVDYLQSLAFVDGRKLGVTGASGGGNQSMYAGAMDDRFEAVVPVCSVGTYMAYLRSACCVCEVLPGGLKIAEEGDVLGLVAPRALLVINATRDSFNFSVEQARLSIERARPIFQLHNVGEKLRHQPFESGHDYNRAMREAMYGWMTKWLKNEGTGQPIAEPNHQIESAEELACYPAGSRPATFMLLPAIAGRMARDQVRAADQTSGAHLEDWESTSVAKRNQLRTRVLGDFPRLPNPMSARLGESRLDAALLTTDVVLTPEPGLTVAGTLIARQRREAGGRPLAVVLHLEGKNAARNHALTAALLDADWNVLCPELRATGDARPERDAVGPAPDHNSAEHALWIGRPLLGQWTFDVGCWLDWASRRADVDRRRCSVIGIGHAGLVALSIGACWSEMLQSVVTIGTVSTLVTDRAYPAGTPMGILAPGLFQVGDVPHLAGLIAPKKLAIIEAKSSAGETLAERPLNEAFAFTRRVFGHTPEGARNLLLQPSLRTEALLRGILT